MTKTKQTKRTDPHRKGAIIPGEYIHVLSYNGATMVDGWPIPPFGGNCEMDRRVYDAEGRLVKNGEHDPDGCCCVIGLLYVAKAKFAQHGTTGKCTACGASFVYGEVWKHEPTGEHIHVGHICGEKYGFMVDRSAFELAAGRHRQATATQLKRQMNAKKRADFLAEHPGLEEALKIDHYIIKDIADRFTQWCSISEKQVALVMKIARELANPKPEEVHVDAPVGQQTFTGRVVSVKSVEGYYGWTTKMLVKVEQDGGCWLAWGTAPAKLLDAARDHGCNLKGCLVEVTANLTRGNDRYFALTKRPRGTIIEFASAEENAA